MALPKMDSNKIFASIIKSQAKDRLEEFRQYTLEIEAKFDSDKKSLANSYVSGHPKPANEGHLKTGQR